MNDRFAAARLLTTLELERPGMLFHWTGLGARPERVGERLAGELLRDGAHREHVAQTVRASEVPHLVDDRGVVGGRDGVRHRGDRHAGGGRERGRVLRRERAAPEHLRPHAAGEVRDPGSEAEADPAPDRRPRPARRPAARSRSSPPRTAGRAAARGGGDPRARPPQPAGSAAVARGARRSASTTVIRPKALPVCRR